MTAYVLVSSAGGASHTLAPIILIGLPIVIMLSLLIFMISRYRRCPSNKVLVVYGKIEGNRAAQILHGGGTMVWPLVQGSAYLSLEPRTIDVDLAEALARNDFPAGATAVFTVAIST